MKYANKMQRFLLILLQMTTWARDYLRFAFLIDSGEEQ